ncbi:hypothetical protein [Geobacter sulfurreducens]|uniref:hypothetical protein n=1 Tax=Geobacter sulfurreducens TaxID=35554 RepID=UPI0020B66B42|nr:hypothetical protein [Geobacter sulfurreducens]UTG94179.1 hypothetical protein J8622_07665 [Geobacter sulfurreducens]
MIDEYTGKKIVSPLDLPATEKIESLVSRRSVLISELSAVTKELSELGIKVTDLAHGTSWELI